MRRVAPLAAAVLFALPVAACSVTEAVYTQIHVLNRTSTPVEIRAPSADRFVAPACGEGYRVNFDASEAAIRGPDGTPLAVIAATVPAGRVVLQRLWVVLTPDALRLYPEASAPPPDIPPCGGPARPIASPTAPPPSGSAGGPVGSAGGPVGSAGGPAGSAGGPVGSAGETGRRVVGVSHAIRVDFRR